MKNLEWLLSSDPVIKNLTKKYLLDEKVDDVDDGFVGSYLELYNKETKKWGEGFYGPKWISTNYTLLELKYMEIDPKHQAYQDSLKNYLDHFFSRYIDNSDISSMDLCITGMFIALCTYGNIQDQRLDIMIDYVLDHMMPDGAWNCLWNHQSRPKISSVHTTINVLEGLQEYINQGYPYRVLEVRQAILSAIKTLLDRELIYVKKTHTPIHPSIVAHHYPPRWKYDYLRILEFLAKIKYPFVSEMKPAMDCLIEHMKHGRLTKGQTIPGKIHFPLENDKFGRFNTLRAYIVLKEYLPALYDKMKQINIS